MTPVPPRPRLARGTILLNALVLVAALSAAAVLLLARAEGARVRAAAQVETAQLGALLNGAEALALERVFLTSAPGPVASGGSWASPVGPVAAGPGQITARIEDLQGRFNLNRLADPQDEDGREVFERLVARLGLPGPVATAVMAHLGAPSGTDAARYGAMVPPRSPRGGALATHWQLADVPGLDAGARARLSAHVAALPGDARLNVNTAGPEVLASLLPGATGAALAQLRTQAGTRPFTSREAFIQTLRRRVPAGTADGLDPGRLDIRSNWFLLHAEARLGDRIVRRQAVIEVRPLPEPARVAYRADQWF